VQIYFNSWELKFVRVYGDPSRNLFKQNGSVTFILVTSVPTGRVPASVWNQQQRTKSHLCR